MWAQKALDLWTLMPNQVLAFWLGPLSVTSGLALLVYVMGRSLSRCVGR